MLDRMNGLERTIVITALIVGVVLLVSQIVQAITGRAAARRHFDAEMLAHARAHELELADREVEMWKALLETPPASAFTQRRRAPELVGGSQVVPLHARAVRSREAKPGDMVIYGHGQGIGVAAGDMPMPTAEAGEEGPRTPPAYPKHPEDRKPEAKDPP